MIDDDFPDLYLSGSADLIAEAIEEMHGWPDLNPDVLAALMELPDTLVELTNAWPW
ncbi:MAG: hypothetical protein WBM15_13870 [Chromatiaceae bacterium]